MLRLDYSKLAQYPVSERWVRQLLAVCLGRMRLAANKDYQISVAVVDNPTMRRLNREYRHKDSVTDVLAIEGDHQSPDFATDSIKDLGEIIICYPQTVKQAREFGVAWRFELTKLLIHGFLHVLGYDHIRAKDAQVMEPLEDKLMRAAKRSI